MIRSTPERLSPRSAEKINEQIEHETQCTIAYYAKRLDQIEQRLSELDGEWDVQRTLQNNAGILSAVGGALALLFGRKWGLLSLVAGSFMVQHAVSGWCPPVTMLRRLGFRTRHEIDDERSALKAVMGDFQGLEKDEGEAFDRACKSLDAARKHRQPLPPGRTHQPRRRKTTQDEQSPRSANIPPGHVSMVPGDMGEFGRSAPGSQAQGNIAIP